MSIRSQARLWFEINYGKVVAPAYSSKYYQPEESWPKKSVWWFQVPSNLIEKNLNGHINLICQVAPNENDFHYLKVPCRFLFEHLKQFHLVGDKISLYLSTDPKRLYIEEKGAGSLDFSHYLIKK